MNADIVVVYSGSPPLTASDSVTTTAALPLSYIATSVDVMVAVPSTGISRWSVTDCWPCTSIAGLNEPILPKTDPDPPNPTTTGNVGRTRWGVFAVFSVVNASSSVPAPTPTA